METKYSKKTFDGFTHRFIVKFQVDDDWRNDRNITIYSNNESFEDLTKIINTKKSENISFEIVHRASKEDDEFSDKFIDDLLMMWH